MNEPWRIAEIMEEIVRKADPVVVLRRTNQNPERDDGMLTSISAGLTNDDCSATYSFPVERIMGGTSGTPEEVVEWLHTGLRPNERAAIMVLEGRKYLSLTQRCYDERMGSELRRLMGFSVDEVSYLTSRPLF